MERNRYYVEAIGMLRQLLGTSHTPHRRGRWWLRLSLDLSHIGAPVEACAACMDAVEDRDVPPGDLIALQRRLVRLQRCVVALPWARPASLFHTPILTYVHILAAWDLLTGCCAW
jgi:hypothetical protein